MTTFSPLFPDGMTTKPTGRLERLIANRIGARRGITGIIADEIQKELGGSSSHVYTRVKHSVLGGVREVEDYTADEYNNGRYFDTTALSEAFGQPKTRPLVNDKSGNGAGSRW